MIFALLSVPLFVTGFITGFVCRPIWIGFTCGFMYLSHKEQNTINKCADEEYAKQLEEAVNKDD